MPRRPLVATLVTTAIGALLGGVLGAIVGRVIATLGDATIQPSVPMAFCATLGFFIGAPAAAKGSLDRFGAKRSSLGAGVAAAIIIVVFGLLNVGTDLAGVVLVPLAVVVTALAAVAATALGQPQERPVAAVAVAGRSATSPDNTIGGQIAAPFLVDEPAKPRASSAARRVPTTMRSDFDEEDEDDEDDDWSFLDNPQPEPEPEPPRRRAPLRAVRPDPEPEAAPESDAPRPRRDRPLRRGDAE